MAQMLVSTVIVNDQVINIYLTKKAQMLVLTVRVNDQGINIYLIKNMQSFRTREHDLKICCI